MQTVANRGPGRTTMMRSGLLRRIKQSRREHREHAAGVAAIFLFTIIVCAPLFSGKTFSEVAAYMVKEYPWAGVVHKNPEVTGDGYPQTDFVDTYYPNEVFGTQAIRNGELPMWLPYSFNGVPLLELGLTGWLYPPRLFLMLWMSPIHQHDVLIFTHLLMAGLAMYALLRLWGANLPGAILGGLVWELNGHNAFWLTLEVAALVAAWLPVMLLAATLAIRKLSYKWAIAAGVALGMAELTASLHYVYLSALVLIGWYGVQAGLAGRRQWREGDRRAAMVALSLPAVSALAAIALSAANWLPLLNQLGSAYRPAATFDQQLAEAIPYTQFAFAVVWPETMSGPAGRLPDYASFAHTGIIAFILAAAAFAFALTARARRPAPVVLSVITCFLSLGFALGWPPLVGLLRRVLPQFGTFHPHESLYLFCFGISVLAAFGMTEAGQLLSAKWPRARVRYGVFAVGGLLIIINAAQLLAFMRAVTPMQPERPEWLFPETTLTRTLRNMQGSYHILSVDHSYPAGKEFPVVLSGKVSANFGLRSGAGYESLLPLPTAELWRTVEKGGQPAQDILMPQSYRPYFYHDQLPIALLEKISVGFLVLAPTTAPRDAHGSDPVADDRAELVYQGADGWIYRLNRALPRAFIVPQVMAAPDSEASLRMLADESFNARRSAIIIGEPAAAATGLLTNDAPAALDASAAIVNESLNEVEIEARTARAGLLVFNDSWAPGWRAYVDGVPQTVLRVNHAFRGVVLAAGKHQVVFRYRPLALIVGLWISGATLFFVLVLYLAAPLRRLRFTRQTPTAP
jgi:predicted transporter